ncbi:MAG TPA: hypothetical protein DCZ95_03275 [Verrucomicrobia bacterium]|nr:hypothetical protein [Verrucomicrobiota bacterium]
MGSWYYHESGQQKRPIAEAELMKLFESGALSASTLVWTEPMKEWQEARTMEGFFPPSFTAPPLSHTVAPPLSQTFVPSGPQARPWIRYWARTIDIYWLCIGYCLWTNGIASRRNCSVSFSDGGVFRGA